MELLESSSCPVLLDDGDIDQDFLQASELVVGERAYVSYSITSKGTCDGSVIQFFWVYPSPDASLVSFWSGFPFPIAHRERHASPRVISFKPAMAWGPSFEPVDSLDVATGEVGGRDCGAALMLSLHVGRSSQEVCVVAQMEGILLTVAPVLDAGTLATTLVLLLGFLEAAALGTRFGNIVLWPTCNVLRQSSFAEKIAKS